MYQNPINHVIIGFKHDVSCTQGPLGYASALGATRLVHWLILVAPSCLRSHNARYIMLKSLIISQIIVQEDSLSWLFIYSEGSVFQSHDLLQDLHYVDLGVIIMNIFYSTYVSFVSSANLRLRDMTHHEYRRQ